MTAPRWHGIPMWLRKVLLVALLLAGSAFITCRFMFLETSEREMPALAAASQWPPTLPAATLSQAPAVLSQVYSPAYNHLRHSADPAERAHAYRIWSTCSQRMAATAAAGRAPEALLVALPESPSRSQREAALAAIDALCRNLLGTTFAAGNAGTDESHQLEFDAAHGTATPAALAIKLALDQGDRLGAQALLQATLQSHDPESLVELALADIDLAADAAQQDASRLRRAALALVACDGHASRACDPSNLMALKLCVYQDRCDGPVADRVIPLLGFGVAELRASAERLRVLISRNDDTAMQYLAGADANATK